MWVRGLKQILNSSIFCYIIRRTLCGCVDWNYILIGRCTKCTMSHPMWVRGLKPRYERTIKSWLCRTLCGCVDWNRPHQWRYDIDHRSHPMWVRGLKLLILRTLLSWSMSHPMWVRGLKHALVFGRRIHARRTLCGCVDWNVQNLAYKHPTLCRTLCGCVDWNLNV